MIENESRQAKIDFLREWCALIIRFLGTLAPSGVLRQLEQAVAASSARGDEPGLSAIAEDLAAWARALGSVQQRELDALLLSRFGTGLADAERLAAAPPELTPLVQGEEP